MDLNILDISSTLGLLAACVMTANLLMGMMISTNYQKSIYWQKLPDFLKKWDIYNLHNWTAYVALTLILAHPLLLLLDKSTKFELSHILLPVDAPQQALFVAFGVISMYAIIIVVITTQKVVKKRLGFRLWKNIHFLSLAVTPLFLLHGIVMDPLLKDRPIDYFDGEKLLLELCALVILVAGVWRVRYKNS